MKTDTKSKVAYSIYLSVGLGAVAISLIAGHYGLAALCAGFVLFDVAKVIKAAWKNDDLRF